MLTFYWASLYWGVYKCLGFTSVWFQILLINLCNHWLKYKNNLKTVTLPTFCWLILLDHIIYISVSTYKYIIAPKSLNFLFVGLLFLSCLLYKSLSSLHSLKKYKTHTDWFNTYVMWSGKTCHMSQMVKMQNKGNMTT